VAETKFSLIHGVNVALVKYARVLPVVLSIFLIKLVFLYFDTITRFIIGDSVVYLNTAISHIPTDRSWTYGLLFLKPVIALTNSINAVVFAQTFFSGLSCFALYLILYAQIGLTNVTSTSIAILACLEPLSLIYDRFIMTDSLAWSLMALLFFLSLAIIKTPREYLIIKSMFFSILVPAVASLRSFYLPVLVLITLAVTIALLVRLPNRRLSQSALFIALVIGSNIIYLGVAHRISGFASYNTSSGFFLLAAWAPNIRAADFPALIDGSAITCKLELGLSDIRNRPGHLFTKGGLINVLRDHVGDSTTANIIARSAAINSLYREPNGVLSIVWQTYMGYLDQEYLKERLLNESGIIKLDSNILKRAHSRFNETLAENHLVPSFFRSLLVNSAPWSSIIVLLSLGLSMFGLLLRTLPSAFVSLCAMAILFSAVAFATEPVPRYLVGLPWLCLLLYGQILKCLCTPSVPIGKTNSFT